jgi:hypothetical protein
MKKHSNMRSQTLEDTADMAHGEITTHFRETPEVSAKKRLISHPS